MKVEQYLEPRQSTMLDYAVNVYKDGVFQICHRFKGWSGTAVHEEVRFMKQNQYPVSEGWTLEW